LKHARNHSLLVAVGCAAALLFGVTAAWAGGTFNQTTASETLQRASDSGTADQQPVVNSPYGTTDPISTTGADTAEAVVADATKALGDADVVSVSIGKPSDPETDQQSLWLQVVVRAADAESGLVSPVWESHVLAGVIRDRLHDAGLPRLSGLETGAQLPDGHIIRVGSWGVEGVAVDQQFDTSGEAELRSVIESNAAQLDLGLTVQSVRFLHGIQEVPIVRLVSTDPKAAVAASDRIDQALFGGDASSVEGYCVEIDDVSGIAVSIQASASRAGIGSTWTAPGYLSGVASSGSIAGTG
jgi:hypothetical protein